MNKKGQLATFQNAILGFVILCVVLVVGMNILSQLRDQSTTSTDTCNTWNDTSGCTGYAFNSTTTTLGSVAQFPSWFSIIVLVIVGAVIFGLLRAFGSAGQ